MARIQYSKFAGRKGATIKCSKCGDPIEKGNSYRFFSPYFRSRTKIIRCMKSECTPKRSETDSSKMSGVWSAIEDAEANLGTLAAGDPEDDTSSIEQAVRDAADPINDVAQEYRDAAEASPTGLVFGEDLNEKADAIESGASELEGWDADDNEPDFDQCEEEHHDDHDESADHTEDDHTAVERGDVENCESCKELKQTWWDEQIEAARSSLSDTSFE